MKPDEKHVALVVSPLRSLMMSQVQSLTEIGVKACAILQAAEMEVGVKAGN